MMMSTFAYDLHHKYLGLLNYSLVSLKNGIKQVNNTTHRMSNVLLLIPLDYLIQNKNTNLASITIFFLTISCEV